LVLELKLGALTRRVQLTETTGWFLGNAFQFEERGTIPAKGAGMLHTWFLIGRVGSLPESGAARGTAGPRCGNVSFGKAGRA
jgi:hypothetical protein